jgi:amidohydrolase
MERFPQQVAAAAGDIAGDVVRMRRDLHRHPELSWNERRTTYRVAGALEAAGLAPVVRPDGVGLAVEIGEGPPVVGFRADIDALPILERTGLPYRSLTDGVMHACGHDAHTAVGVGIARVLATIGPLPGTARIIFQPAEETLPSGAAVLIEEGAHAGLRSLLAFHVDPTIPAGAVGLRPGPITSAADKLTITVTGPGGHTSRPERTVDLVRVAASIVGDLPDLIRDGVGPGHHLAIAFGRICGGQAANAIPTEIELTGTVRVQDGHVWRSLPAIIDRALRSVVAGSGAGVELEHRRGSPPVDNDPSVVAVIRDAASVVPVAVVPTPQSMCSEDFSWFLEHVPGALVRLGVGTDGEPVDLHSPTFVLDEAALEHGVAVGALSLIRLMERSS